MTYDCPEGIPFSKCRKLMKAVENKRMRTRRKKKGKKSHKKGGKSHKKGKKDKKGKKTKKGRIEDVPPRGVIINRDGTFYKSDGKKMLPISISDTLVD